MKIMPCVFLTPAQLHISTLYPTDHPKVRLFISHGGLLGTIEAAYVGVPMVGIPMFGDQPINVKAVVDNKMGISLNYGDINKERVLKAIRTVLDEPRYALHCKLKLFRYGKRKLSRCFLDTMP